MIQEMARKGGNEILTSPCFSKIFLFYISLFLSIPCLSFTYSIWFLIISISVLLLSTLLHISLYNKKPANRGSLQTPVQEGTPKFHLQDNFRGQGTATEPETYHKAKEVMKLEAADSNNDENEEEEGLIEIALAGEEAKEEKMSTVMKCLSDSGLIKQEEEKIMMEIWAEVEEENFIEIDLSMGSISSLKF